MLSLILPLVLVTCPIATDGADLERVQDSIAQVIENTDATE